MTCNNCETVGFDGQSRGYRRVLVAVLAINLTMFLVEVVGGHLSGSKALWADSLDFAADSATYAISFLAIGWSLRRRSVVALIKGASLAVMGVVVLITAIMGALALAPPEAPIMGGIAVAALVANSVSVLLLLRYRDGDANVRSVWLCSRNDAIGNIAVMISAGLVAVTGSGWPDIGVAAVMAMLFLTSAFGIIRQALSERRLVASDTHEECHHGDQT